MIGTIYKNGGRWALARVNGQVVFLAPQRHVAPPDEGKPVWIEGIKHDPKGLRATSWDEIEMAARLRKPDAVEYWTATEVAKAKAQLAAIAVWAAQVSRAKTAAEVRHLVRPQVPHPRDYTSDSATKIAEQAIQLAEAANDYFHSLCTIEEFPTAEAVWNYAVKHSNALEVAHAKLVAIKHVQWAQQELSRIEPLLVAAERYKAAIKAAEQQHPAPASFRWAPSKDMLDCLARLLESETGATGVTVSWNGNDIEVTARDASDARATARGSWMKHFERADSDAEDDGIAFAHSLTPDPCEVWRFHFTEEGKEQSIERARQAALDEYRAALRQWADSRNAVTEHFRQQLAAEGFTSDEVKLVIGDTR